MNAPRPDLPGRFAGICAIVCFIVGSLLWLGPDIARKDIFNGDAAHHVFWLYRYADPELFPDDLSIEYFGSGAVAPLGYRYFYAGIARYVDVLTASEWMSVVLLGITVFIAWLLGRELALRRESESDARLVGLFCVAATLAVLPQTDLVPAMGFQRTFALPLTLLCLWALISRRYVWVGVSWLAAALFYPVIIAVLGLAACIVFLLDLIRDRRMPPAWIANGIFGILAISIILAFATTPPDVGPGVSYEQALAMPEFGRGGRQVLFGTGLGGAIFRHHRTGLGWSPYAVALMVGAVLLTAALGYRKLIPRPALVLAGTGVGLWLLARLTLFDLYLPNRHSRYTLAAMFIVALALAAYAMVRQVTTMLVDRPATTRAVISLAQLAAPIVVAIALTPSAIADWKKPVDESLERTYAYLETLPPDTVIAAHPDVANYIPLRSKRSVLASTEGWIAFMLGYHARMTPRIEASLRAAYATDWSQVESVLRPYDVDVIVSSAESFNATSYHPPLDGLAQDLLEKGRRDNFALADPPADRVLFRDGDYIVVRLDPRPEADSP